MTTDKKQPIDIESEEQFDKVLAAAPGEVLVDFVLDGCGACEDDAPKIEALAQGCDVTVLRVNADKVGALVDRYKVQEFPTLLHSVDAAGMTPKKAKNVEPEDVIKKLKCTR